MKPKLLLSLAVLFITAAGTARAGAYEDALIAAREGRVQEIAALIQRGLDVNTTDREGNTLLALATRSGELRLVDMLLHNRASPNRRNSYGDTPVLLAATQGKLPLVKRLVEGGADLTLPGWSALHYAIYGGFADVSEYVLSAGADINQRAPNQRTALMLAAQLGNLSMAQLLVSRGADTSLTEPDGKTAADIAAGRGFQEVADFLRKAKPAQ
jgi:ankyrin repeat protein